MILKEQLAPFSELSEASHETVVSPNGNEKLSGWEHVRLGELSTLSHTAGMKATSEAVEAPPSVTKIASEQFRVGAWLSALKSEIHSSYTSKPVSIHPNMLKYRVNLCVCEERATFGYRNLNVNVICLA